MIQFGSFPFMISKIWLRAKFRRLTSAMKWVRVTLGLFAFVSSSFRRQSSLNPAALALKVPWWTEKSVDGKKTSSVKWLVHTLTRKWLSCDHARRGSLTKPMLPGRQLPSKLQLCRFSKANWIFPLTLVSTTVFYKGKICLTSKETTSLYVHLCMILVPFFFLVQCTYNDRLLLATFGGRRARNISLILKGPHW